jgi:phage-related protein
MISPPWPRPLHIIFFRTEAGHEPVREWLKELSKEDRKIIGEDLKTLQFRWPLGMPLVRPLDDKIYEVRTNLPHRIARTLFFIHKEEIILLHGFIKKTRQTPTEELNLAKKRKLRHLAAYEE